MSCPGEMKPSVEFLTCERNNGSALYGSWKFPSDVRKHGIVCLEPHQQNPYKLSYKKPKCENLNEKFFDETVNVSERIANIEP